MLARRSSLAAAPRSLARTQAHTRGRARSSAKPHVGNFASGQKARAGRRVHMKGRIYDPTLGRFLQPDPIVEDDLNPQTWNRYTYVRNNPMTFTDPTGYVTKGSNGCAARCERQRERTTERLIGQGWSISGGGSNGGSSRNTTPAGATEGATNNSLFAHAWTKFVKDAPKPGDFNGVTNAFEANAIADQISGSGDDRGGDQRDPWSYSDAELQEFVDNSPQVTFDLPLLPQPLVDFAAGFGDTVSMGAAAYIREGWNIDGRVDVMSDSYDYGGYAGIANSLAMGAGLFTGATRAGGTVAATRWGGEGVWYMVGGRSTSSWWLSGTRFTYTYKSAVTIEVAGGRLVYPSGRQWFKGFLGQRVLLP